MKTITLDDEVMQAIAGNFDEGLRLIEKRFRVTLAARGNDVTVSADGENGAADRIAHVTDLLGQIAGLHDRGVRLGREDLKAAITLKEREPSVRLTDHFIDARIDLPGGKSVAPRSDNQRRYIQAIRNRDLVFGIGPAGTGKTYLAVAMATALLMQRRVKRIILARPAVEAGERLGFLPGDLAAKVDPYLRPLYDALYDMLEPDRTERLLEQGAIEVAPLAFMRGRTLDHSFMILDEAQNSTSEQMKMFLTRMGLESKAVVTGDVTQIDLPPEKVSGLVEARNVVEGISGVTFSHFTDQDVVRHPLVQRIVLAYDRHQSQRRGQDSVGSRGQDSAPDLDATKDRS